MDLVKQTTGYDMISRLNHWAVAGLFLIVFAVGFAAYTFMADGPSKGAAIGLHKGLGVIVLILGGWRGLYRLKKGFPAAASAMPRWQRVSAHLVHWLLLTAIIVFPVTGLIGSYFGGRAVEVFGFFTIPAGPEVDWISSLAYGIHAPLAYICLAGLALHIGGALKHHFIDRDSTLTRMTRGG